MGALFEQLAGRMVADLVRDYKLQAFQAAAFPGNAGEESGGFTKLQEQNPKSGRGGLGFFQDTGPRRVAFEAWLARNADKHYSASDYAANYSFLVRELDGPEAHVLTPLRATRTIEEATEVVMRVFERPYAPTAHLEVRIDYARKALAVFMATGVDENMLRAQGRPGADVAEVMSPQLHTLPSVTQLAPLKHDIDLQQLWPMVMAVLSFVQKYRQSKGESTDITQIVLDIGQKMTMDAPDPVVITQTKEVAAQSAITRPSVQISALAGIAGVAAQLFGGIAPPVGETSSVIGTLTSFLPAASALMGLTGTWGTVAKVGLGALRLIGGAVSKSAAPK